MRLVIVRFECVRSAEPPSVVSIEALIPSSAISEALRDATFGASATSSALKAAMRAVKSAGRSPDIAALNRARSGCSRRRSSHAKRSPRDLSPAARHAANTSAGISNGG